ncbi:MAG: hypothetical protein WD851_02825 [Pirellulales bacterium]
MHAAIIFAIMAGRPVVLEYRGDLGLPYDPRFATVISLEEAERRMRKRKPPVLLAMVGGPVIRATHKEALSLLSKWQTAKDDGDQKRMKAALKRAGKQARARKIRAR